MSEKRIQNLPYEIIKYNKDFFEHFKDDQCNFLPKIRSVKNHRGKNFFFTENDNLICNEKYEIYKTNPESSKDITYYWTNFKFSEKNLKLETFFWKNF
jgi:hypothetical protein